MKGTCLQFGVVAAWCVLMSGCSVCQLAMRTMWYEPSAYSSKHDRRRSVELYQHLADRAWLEELSRCPELFAEGDYVLGFRDGFVDYVYAGGNGEPPPVPPRQFWNAMLRSPDGKQKADRWFAGYRHGARVAREGGYRELGTISTSLNGPPPGFDSTEYTPQLPDREQPEAEAYGPEIETLPEPRPSVQRLNSLPEPVHDEIGALPTATEPAQSNTEPMDAPAEEAAPELPVDLTLPWGEPDANQSSRPPALRPGNVEPAAMEVASELHFASGGPDLTEVAMENESPPEARAAGLTKLPARRESADRVGPSTIVLRLEPTPSDNRQPAIRAGQPPAAEDRLILTTASVPAECGTAAEASTIRVRHEVEHAPRTFLRAAPVRRAMFER